MKKEIERSFSIDMNKFILKHIYREANGCVDILAKVGCDQQVDFLRFSIASAHVLAALDFDISNVIRYRFV